METTPTGFNAGNREAVPSDYDGPISAVTRISIAPAALKVIAATSSCDRLIGFTEYRYPRYRTAPHHRFVATHLERVERREIDRLMIFMPPRHGKSELASKSYPSWTIGRSPWKQFISASATADVAHDWGREVRNIVASEQYQMIFPTRLSEDSKAAGKWNTQQGGCYYAIGVGGNPIGRGADEFMIDDPFGSMEDAKSTLIRDKVWDWYQGTATIASSPRARSS
jgi:hypothetical protein